MQTLIDTYTHAEIYNCGQLFHDPEMPTWLRAKQGRSSNKKEMRDGRMMAECPDSRLEGQEYFLHNKYSTNKSIDTNKIMCIEHDVEVKQTK